MFAQEHARREVWQQVLCEDNVPTAEGTDKRLDLAQTKSGLVVAIPLLATDLHLDGQRSVRDLEGANAHRRARESLRSTTNQLYTVAERLRRHLQQRTIRGHVHR